MSKDNIPIFNPSDRQIGYINPERKEYRKIIEYPKQMFVHYDNSIAISKSVIRQLIQDNITHLIFLIRGYEKEDFFAIITLNDFLKHSWDTTDMFKGKCNADSQRAVPLRFWTRHYYRQQNTLTF